MCLDLEIELPAPFASGAIGARRLSREVGLRVAAYHTTDGQRRFYFARGKECSCSLLADGFAIEEASWPLEPDAGAAMAKAVALVASSVPSFTVRTVWAGSEEDPAVLRFSLPELLDTLRSNQLPAHALIQVVVAA